MDMSAHCAFVCKVLTLMLQSVMLSTVSLSHMMEFGFHTPSPTDSCSSPHLKAFREKEHEKKAQKHGQRCII